MNEKDLLQKIKESAETITPPASLEPEAIEQMLQNRQGRPEAPARPEQKPAFGEPEVPASRPQRRRRKTGLRPSRIVQFGSIAAVFVLAITVFWHAERISKHSESDGTAILLQEETGDMSTDAQTISDDSVPETAIAEGAADSGANTARAGSEEAATADDSAHAKAEMAEDSVDSGASTARAGSEEAAATNDSAHTITGAASADASNAATITEDSADSKRADTAGSAPIELSEGLSYASSYEEIYDALYKKFYVNDTGIAYGLTRDAATAEVAMDMDSVSSTAEAGGSVDFSSTNLQEIGVDEGDIIKTDGDCIYILRQDASLAIVKADGAASRLLSLTSLAQTGDIYIHEMYLDGDMLYVITGESTYQLVNDADVYYKDFKRQTRLSTYDVSDPENPVLSGTVTQDGYYQTSRKNGQYLYLFTSYFPDIAQTYADSSIVPRINGTEAAAEDFYLPETLESSAYLVISSVDAEAPGEILDSKILVSGVSNFYVSTENIYIANERYDSATTTTELIKFHYETGQITGIAAGSVRGYLNNSFSMNEYDGMLRVVSTYYGDEYNAVRDFISNFTGEYYEQNWEEHNALYVLDESLQQVGAIEGLAEGETIRSARFFGDIGYFVTFRQTDPLFSVDLSDPANPKILGELKISGFSSYLHPYGENLLLGIGYEADEESGTVSGLKLSMFDISDPANVTEINKLVLPGITWCPAIEDYKAILVSPDKSLIGFCCDNRYMVFSYDAETGFARELLYDFYSDLIAVDTYSTMRGLYIEDTLYLAGNTFLLSFNMENGYEKSGLLTIE